MPFIDDDLLWCPDNDGRMVDLSCLVNISILTIIFNSFHFLQKYEKFAKFKSTPLDGDLFLNENPRVVLSAIQTAAQSVQPTAVPPLNQGGEFSDLTELSHADLNGLVSEIEGEDEIFKQFGNFELDNIFAEFDEKVSSATCL